MGFISLKSDYAFRELFSHENVRKQFLSDVLGIAMEDIREVRVINSYLWKRMKWQKQGILDMALELADGTKVNIEMQVRLQRHWVKRKLFYLAKLYTEDLRAGQDYGRLRKCVSISILDFELLKGEDYHSVYTLRSRNGNELTDLLELHILELGKRLSGTGAVDDWIRLFNAKGEEDLEMIKAKNAGITEAIEALRRMSLRRPLRYLFEQHLKAVRERRAEDEYVWDQGMAEGIRRSILQLLEGHGDVPADIAERIAAEDEIDTLSRWFKIAARTGNIEQFAEECHFF